MADGENQMLKVFIEDDKPSWSLEREGTCEKILWNLIDVITAIHESYRLEDPLLANCFRIALMRCLQSDEAWSLRANTALQQREQLEQEEKVNE